MKIHRHGAYRNRGTSLLISEDVTKLTQKKWGAPSFNANLGEFDFMSDGTDRGVNYRYYVTLGASDLLSLLEVAVPKLDPALRAVSLGALASLREILIPKDEGKLKAAA